MKYPLRAPEGNLRLEVGDFGILDPAYLFALIDLVKGFSNENSARRVSERTGTKFSRTMIRDSFRRNLYLELRRFPGAHDRLTFRQYCTREKLPDSFDGSDHNQVAFCMARYLIDVFDLREPVEIVISRALDWKKA